jgi:hypothetical protein
MLWREGGVTPVAILILAGDWARKMAGAASTAEAPATEARKRRRDMGLS